MTSLIAILNKSAVALAADSAGTISTSAGRRKVYFEQNKLFTLSKYHPVGIMIYDNVEFMGIPWETLVKEHRDSIADNHSDSIQDCLAKFLEYIESSVASQQQSQDQYFANTTKRLFISIIRAIDNNVQEEFNRKPKVSPQTVSRIATKTIDGFLELAKEADQFSQLPSNAGLEIRKKYKKEIDLAVNEVFQNLPLYKIQRKKLHQLVGVTFSSHFLLSVANTGIVVVGFGQKEMFPHLRLAIVGGIVLDRLCFFSPPSQEQYQDISTENPAVIIPFAQREMVATYMDGIHPDYKERSKKVLSEATKELSRRITKALKGKTSVGPKKLFAALDAVCTEIINVYNSNMEQHSRQRHSAPTMEIVRFLSAKELALMAESLVSITSLRRKMSMDIESVGGPIDVAVISRGDGFVWIKRKHYFDRNLNPHFLKTYYQQRKKG